MSALKTRQLAINFAPRDARTVWGRGGRTALLALLSGVLAAVLPATELWQLHSAAAEQRASLLEQERQARNLAALAKRLAPRAPAISAAEAAAVNRAIRELNLPWRDLWDAAELAAADRVAMLSLEPDAKNLLLRGSAEARDADAMIAFIEELKRQPFFTSAVLTGHESVEKDPQHPLRFRFEARWNRVLP